ncbi:MAG: FAD-dependent oxidoreductase [Methanobacteriota archaeon]
MSNIVIVGFQSAGLTAAAAVRLFDREAKVTVVERRNQATYHPCGLPFAIGGEVQDIRQLVDAVPKMPGVNVLLGTEAKSIDAKAKALEVQDRKTLKTEKIPYDKLILATGSLAFKPPIPGAELENVFTLRTMRDGEDILAALPQSKKAVVIGAGPIGVEVAGALKGRGLEVVLVEMQPSVLPGMLDPDMSELVLDHISKSGVKTICSKPVKEIRGEGKVNSVALEGEEIPADMVIMAIGVKPDVELAVKTGLKLGPTKTIAVDEFLRTSDPDIFAVGDCAESRCFITNRPVWSQLATTAIRMSKVAGINAAGGKETFEGVLNTVVSSACGLEIASTGLTANASKAAGIDTVAARVRTLSKPHYFPGAETIFVKLVAQRKERRVIGGQIIGDGAAERANLIALAIKKRTTVDELSRMEYCYAPPANNSIEPIMIAADALLRRL